MKHERYVIAVLVMVVFLGISAATVAVSGIPGRYENPDRQQQRFTIPTTTSPTGGSVMGMRTATVRTLTPVPVTRVLLPIPDRDEDLRAPEEGWCAEACIQMALAYFGKQVSQPEINRAGSPQHPDLWEEDIGKSLTTLCATYTRWDLQNTDLKAFIDWTCREIRAGHPVLIGVKFYPDETGWDNDHFVLAVGYDQGGLFINTNNAGDGQYYAPFTELTGTSRDSYSLINSDNRHYGWAIQGLRSTTPTPVKTVTPTRKTPTRTPTRTKSTWK